MVLLLLLYVCIISIFLDDCIEVNKITEKITDYGRDELEWILNALGQHQDAISANDDYDLFKFRHPKVMEYLKQKALKASQNSHETATLSLNRLFSLDPNLTVFINPLIALPSLSPSLPPLTSLPQQSCPVQVESNN